MNRNTVRWIAKIIAWALAIALVVTSFTFMFSWGDEGPAVYGAVSDSIYNENSIEELIRNIEKHYKDETDLKKILDGAYKGMLEALDDPYSVYYSSSDLSRGFEESVSGEFTGVGLSLESFFGMCRVVAPLPGTPADKAGISARDIITSIDGIDVSDLPLESVSSMLRGEEGTKVSVTVLRHNKRLSFNLIREKINTVSVHFDMLPQNTAYIRIDRFDRDSHTEFKNARLQLLSKGAKSFIVDVRDNPGGYVDVAAAIAEQMMPKGPIVHFERRGVVTETIEADGKGNTGIPLVLLINNGSASASEILAAAWQDSGTAKLVGTTTYGKGVAQQMIPLKNGGSIKLSTLYFLTPGKKSINNTGISPDCYIDITSNEGTKELVERYRSFVPMKENVKPALGSVGLNVYGAQQRLALLGYPVTVSGSMDECTVAAVKVFQRTKGLYSYGVLDYSTMHILDESALSYIKGEFGDAQLEKAIELLNN